MPLEQKKSFEDWFNPPSLTASQQVQLRVLSELDAKCTECNKLMDTMLCRGVRLEYDGVASRQYGRPIIANKACHKLKQFHETEQLVKRLRSSCIPDRHIQAWKSRSPREICTVLLPAMMAEEFSVQVQDQVWDVMLEKIHSGIPCRSILVPILLDHHSSWNSILTAYGVSVDFLALMRFDLGSCPEYKSDFLMQLVRTRQSFGLTTLITYGVHPKARNEKEAELYREMKGWPTFSQGLLNA